MRFLNTNIHGIFDYVIGAFLVAMPFIMGFADVGGPATWVPMIIGVGIIVYSIATDYEWGVWAIIPVKAHLVLDVLAGVTLLMSYLFFGFFDQTLWPVHLLAGIVLIVLGAATHPRTETDRPRFRKPETYIRPPGRRQKTPR